MPVIITGEAGNNGVADFVAALRAGRGDALDRRRAEAMEKQYAQRLQLGTQQIMLNESRLDALGDEERARETYGELEGIWAQAQASGDPANVAGFQVMFNTQPEAVKLWSRLAADSPELANVFRDNILKDAQANMEREQMDSFFTKAQAAEGGEGQEGGFLPQGWTRQALQDVKSSGSTLVEKQREYVRQREKYGRMQAQGQSNEEEMAKLDVLIEAVQDTLKPEQKSELRSLRAQIEAEAGLDPGAGLDKNLYSKAVALITGHQAGDDQWGEESAPIVEGPSDQIQGPGGETYDPFRNVENQPPGASKAVTRARMLEEAQADLPALFQAKDVDALKEWGESRGLTPAGVLELFEIIDTERMQRKAADEAKQNETLKSAPGRATATGVRR